MLQVPQDIQRDEGLRYQAYNDTTGNKAIGYGFNLDSGIGRKVWQKAGIQTSFDDVYEGKAAITDEEARRLGIESYNIAVDDASAVFSNFGELPQTKQQALANLAYQHGRPALSKKKDFVAAVNEGNWNKAVIALNKSGYMAKYPSRGREIARQLLMKS
jgi:GH24 family phage-related lysozyme (muramidase)